MGACMIGSCIPRSSKIRLSGQEFIWLSRIELSKAIVFPKVYDLIKRRRTRHKLLKNSENAARSNCPELAHAKGLVTQARAAKDG
jgi:hypothetical protein